MGLDSGIVAKTENENLRKRLLKKFELDVDKEFVIAYWRKCWNIRCLVIANLRNNNHVIPDNDSRTKLLIKDIDIIIKTLKSFTKDNWTDYGDSIWEYREQKSFNKNYIKNLKKIRRLMKKFPNDLEVYFYDSY